ncbi:MAG: cadherin-like domain-containing protein [Gammaproteobacteria bacterium]|nr:cadherin-like domain-containing protein [Gammaproteobacteria bacterium]
MLTNDTDNDGTLDSSTVTVATKPAYGTTTVANNGQVTYTPNAGYSGADSFTYTVMDDDGATSNIATISVTVNSESVTPPPPSSSGGGSSSFGLLLVLLMLLSLNKQLINTRHS